MKKCFFLFFVILISLNKLFSQEIAHKKFHLDVDSLFTEVYKNLDLSDLSTSYLIDKAVWIRDPSQFSGNFRIDSVSSTPVWKSFVRSFNYCSVKPDNKLHAIVRDLDLFNMNEDTVSIGLIWLKYDRIKEDAVNKKLIRLVGNNLYDNLPRTQSPYETHALCIASPLTEECKKNVIFKLDKRFFISNFSEPIQKIEIDFNDGKGFQTFNFDQLISTYYFTSGEKIITLRISTSSFSYNARFSIQVKEEPIYTIRYDKSNFAPDYTLKIKNYTAGCPSPMGGSCFEGIGYVFLGCDKILDRPIIVVEGFDAENNTGWPEILDLLKGYRFATFLETVYADGYDVIILNFEDARRDIRRNAEVLQELIQMLNEKTYPIRTGNYELVVMGASMGGLVARYALTKMEKEGIDHQVGLLVCYDTPHQGANIPLGIQKITETIKFVKDFDFLFKDAAVLKAQWEGLVSPAAKQMLVYHLDKKSDPMYADFRLELKNLGNYPKQCRNVAIVDGSINSQATPGNIFGTTISSGDKIFDIDRPTWFYNIEVQAWAVPDPTQGGRQVARMKLDLRVSRWVKIPVFYEEWWCGSTLPYDNAPGGLLNTQAQIASSLEFLGASTWDRNRHSFIPSVSAIDLDQSLSQNLFYNIAANNVVANGLTPFDAIYGLASNNSHVTLRNEYYIQDFVKTEIQSLHLYLQNQTISTNKNFKARKIIYAGNNVAPVVLNKKIGDFIIKKGVDVKMEAYESIVLSSGFIVEEGATFEANITTRPSACIGVGGIPGIVSSDVNYSISAKATVTIEEEKEKKIEDERFRIYPNPASNLFQLEYKLDESSDMVMIYIHDGWGRMIKWIERNRKMLSGGYKQEIDISDLYPGIYYCTLKTEKYRIVKKIIVN